MVYQFREEAMTHQQMQGFCTKKSQTLGEWQMRGITMAFGESLVRIVQ